MEDGDPGQLLSLGLGFWNAKVLLSAVELGVFAALSRGPRTSAELVADLGLQGRGGTDFLDALVSLRLLNRSDRRYQNTALVEEFLVPGKPSYVGGALEMADRRLYPVWGKLTDALRSGRPQNEAKSEADYYANLNHDSVRLRTFLSAMTGLSMSASKAIAEKFDWKSYKNFVDVGGAQGVLSVQLALGYPHLYGTNFDLPPIGSFCEEYVASFGLSERIRFLAGDFFAEDLPPADVLIMGHVLHNWNLEQKRLLIQKAYSALPPNGAFIVYEALIDEERKENLFGLLMSLNMLLVTAGGFVFTGSECCSWMREAGFNETVVKHLHGPDSMVIGIKRP